MINNQKIKWGIIGTGRIARAFAEGLKSTNNGELHGIASRNLDSANRFAQEWDISRAFGSYQEMAEADEIDAVYIATPHPFHADLVIRALRAGKHVVVEKPAGLIPGEVVAMADTVVLINEGRLKYNGAIEGLIGDSTLEARFRELTGGMAA